MPTYEYQCQDCGYRVDYFQSIKEAPRTECPRCEGRLTRLVTSGAGLIFKGSGFYITDYKKKSGDNGAAPSSRSTESKQAKDSGQDKTTAKAES